jgi:hypothetical protein
VLRRWRAKRIKTEIASSADAFQREVAALEDAAATVKRVLEADRWKLEGASLVETRVKGGAAFASVPINIAGVRFRVGGAKPVTREKMTVIDEGTFTIEESRATFVGGLHTRTWEYENIVGYVTEGRTQLLIAVSNRQKVSGIRYAAAYDFLVDAALNAAVERHRGNTAAVVEWARNMSAELDGRRAAATTGLDDLVTGKANELKELIGLDETMAYLGTVPGVRASTTEGDT